MKNTHHYTYYSYEEWGRGYIGVRSCDCLPEKDIEYFGSFTDTSFNPNQKIILKSNYETRKEANEDEIILHDFYDVAENPHFANRAKATTTGFDRTGATLTEKTRQKMSESHKGKTHTDETKQLLRDLTTGKKPTEATKQKNRESNLGKRRTEQTKERLRKAKAGERNPSFGKTPTDETKQKISDSLTGENHPAFGKQWYVNASGETRRCQKPPGPGWQLGRRWKG
jgi:hypothetical protein